VRWDDLFADLEGQLAAEVARELDAEVADRTRREAARVRLVDRLRAAAQDARSVVLGVRGLPTPLAGLVTAVGPDWVLVRAPGGEQLVHLPAVAWLTGLGPRAVEPGSEGSVEARFGLGPALRTLARDRAHVRAVLTDGTAFGGTVDRVGADHLELAEHADDEPRRPAAVRQVRVLPFAALAVVRPVEPGPAAADWTDQG
jgi:hypothetical protein